MSKSLKKKNHWTNKVHEAVLTRNKEGELGFDLKEVKQGKVAVQSGKLSQDELLLEVNDTPVAGLTIRDVLAVIKHCKDPFRLKCVKQGEDKHICVRTSERACERPLRCLGLLSVCTLFQQKSCLHTKVHLDTARDRCGYRFDCSRERSIVARGNISYNVADCHVSIYIELFWDCKHRGIRRGRRLFLPDILARGSAMGKLGEYLKAISLIS
ncbi:hypothetical protein PO909_021529 [Leuciscus waleckii]